METTWLKKGMTISLSLAILLLSGCEFSLNGILGTEKVSRPEPTTSVEQPTKPVSANPTAGIAPYYANGDIEYYGEPKKMDNSFLDLIENPGYKPLKESLVANYSVIMWGESQPAKAVTWEEIDHFFRFYEVGTIKAETYKNQKLVILDLECDGPCFSPLLYKFAYNPTKNKLTYLKRHSNEYEAPMIESLIYMNQNNTVFYKGVEPPETIQIPNSDKILELQTAHSSYLPEDLTADKLVFSDNQTGSLYAQSGSGCLRLKAPDGSTSLYGYNPHFFDSETVTASWNDNSPQTNITDKYNYMAGGCGITGNCYLSLSELKDDQLKVIGKTSNGIDLYGVKDPIEGFSIAPVKESGNNPATTTAQQDFDNYYQMYKSTYEYSEDKTIPLMTFQEFIDGKAVVYWKDPFGRWTGIVRADIQPPAECGKPVIYLYPEKTTDVSVQVDVDKFTKTIPEYGKNGWTVKASPDGTLYNYADQQTYPYLFWEGQESNGVTPTQGFSVKRDELESFLDESLTKLGLNSTELKDFKEFWLPRMLENNEQYFMISFLGTSEFNKIAPLTITPAPNTLIRVFMYYHPTNTNYELTAQKLTTLPRKGFTVIEWGGTSSTPWQY